MVLLFCLLVRSNVSVQGDEMPWPVFQILDGRVKTCDLLVLAEVIADTFVPAKGEPLLGEHRLLAAKVKVVIKPDTDGVGQDERDHRSRWEGKVISVAHSYSHVITYPETGVSIPIRQALGSSFTVGQRYFLTIDKVADEYVFRYPAECCYVPVTQEGIADLAKALEKMEVDRSTIEKRLPLLHQMTYEDSLEMSRLAVPDDRDNPGQEAEKWREWWAKTGKRRFTLAPTWRETLEKLKQEVAR